MQLPTKTGTKMLDLALDFNTVESAIEWTSMLHEQASSDRRLAYRLSPHIIPILCANSVNLYFTENKQCF